MRISMPPQAIKGKHPRPPPDHMGMARRNLRDNRWWRVRPNLPMSNIIDQPQEKWRKTPQKQNPGPHSSPISAATASN